MSRFQTLPCSSGKHKEYLFFGILKHVEWHMGYVTGYSPSLNPFLLLPVQGVFKCHSSVENPILLGILQNMIKPKE